MYKIKQAETADIERYIEHRIEFIKYMKGKFADESKFRENTYKFLNKEISSGKVIIYLMEKENEIISSCMVHIVDTLPMADEVYGRMGIVYNVYTKPEYMGNGCGTKLFNMLMDEIKKAGVEKVILKASADGSKLYKKSGFKYAEDIMMLRKSEF